MTTYNTGGADAAPVHLTTGMEAPHRRAELVREVFGRQVLRIELEPVPDADFQVDIQLRQLPGVKLMTGRFNGVETRRTTSLLADGNDDLFLSINLEGHTTGEQRGKQVVLGPGSAYLVSNSERFSSVHLRNRALGLAVPRKAIAALVPDIDDRIARPLQRHSSGLGLLQSYVAALSADPALHGPDVSSATATHIHDLLCHVVGASRDGEEVIAARGLKAARLLAIKSQIDKNLPDHRFSLDSVVVTHRLGRRYVQRLFEEEGTTFSAYVTSRRLTRAKRLLEDHVHAGRTISAIAYDCGFGDVTHFNRIFRRLYGMTPRDVRAQRFASGSDIDDDA